MNDTIYTNINKIIERDSKSSTYKFALLRGVIDMIGDNSPYIEVREDRVYFPTGLLIEKWLLYYYPIFDSEVLIPQINGDTRLAFAPGLSWLTQCYKGKGGFSSFYNDFKNGTLPNEIESDFTKLLRSLRDTITKMPMRYIGGSVNGLHYSIFQVHNSRVTLPKKGIDIKATIESFGTFSIPVDYYHVFKLLGSFIVGQDSILFKWAEFSVAASHKKLSVEQVVNEVLKSPVTEREINASKSLYKSILKSDGNVRCVWTLSEVATYDIDHLIPFSVWKNNDLWNLLPVKASVNGKKSDKIPSPELIHKRKDLIVHYWERIHHAYEERFRKEMQVSLLGNRSFANWQHTALAQLTESCRYLISTRGFEAWNG